MFGHFSISKRLQVTSHNFLKLDSTILSPGCHEEYLQKFKSKLFNPLVLGAQLMVKRT